MYYKIKSVLNMSLKHYLYIFLLPNVIFDYKKIGVGSRFWVSSMIQRIKCYFQKLFFLFFERMFYYFRAISTLSQ